MHEHQQPVSVPIPTDQFTLGEAMTAPKPGQSIVMSVYRTKIAGHCRLIKISWHRDLLSHGFSISIESESNNSSSSSSSVECKVELKPWHFWKKHGCKRVNLDGKVVHVLWDLRNAKFNGDPEPRSGFFIGIESEETEELVLLIGDLKKEALKRTNARPACIEASLVSRKEHVFGKKKFVIRSKLHEKGRFHEVSIECRNRNSGSSLGGNIDPEMEIKIDGHLMVSVKHLQWKFRGNHSITVGKARIEVYWDVYNWLFCPGLSNALFIFKPVMLMSSSLEGTAPSLASLFSSVEGTDDRESCGIIGNGLPGFCLYLHAWKLE